MEWKDFHDKYWPKQTKIGAPRGWIQWKGTDVCMDIHCSCGKLTHVDSDFCYYVKCGVCGKVYMCSGFVELIPVDEEDGEPDSCLVVSDNGEG